VRAEPKIVRVKVREGNVMELVLDAVSIPRQVGQDGSDRPWALVRDEEGQWHAVVPGEPSTPNDYLFLSRINCFESRIIFNASGSVSLYLK
jgi:hypothetical protein